LGINSEKLYAGKKLFAASRRFFWPLRCKNHLFFVRSHLKALALYDDSIRDSPFAPGTELFDV